MDNWKIFYVTKKGSHKMMVVNSRDVVVAKLVTNFKRKTPTRVINDEGELVGRVWFNDEWNWFYEERGVT